MRYSSWSIAHSNYQRRNAVYKNYHIILHSLIWSWNYRQHCLALYTIEESIIKLVLLCVSVTYFCGTNDSPNFQKTKLNTTYSTILEYYIPYSFSAIITVLHIILTRQVLDSWNKNIHTQSNVCNMTGGPLVQMASIKQRCNHKLWRLIQSPVCLILPIPKWLSVCTTAFERTGCHYTSDG